MQTPSRPGDDSLSAALLHYEHPPLDPSQLKPHSHSAFTPPPFKPAQLPLDKTHSAINTLLHNSDTSVTPIHELTAASAPSHQAQFIKIVGILLGCIAITGKALACTFQAVSAEPTYQQITQNYTAAFSLSIIVTAANTIITVLGQTADTWHQFNGSEQRKAKEIDEWQKALSGSLPRKLLKLVALMLIQDSWQLSNTGGRIGVVKLFTPANSILAETLGWMTYVACDLTWLFFARMVLNAIDRLLNLYQNQDSVLEQQYHAKGNFVYYGSWLFGKHNRSYLEYYQGHRMRFGLVIAGSLLICAAFALFNGLALSESITKPGNLSISLPIAIASSLFNLGFMGLHRLFGTETIAQRLAGVGACLLVTAAKITLLAFSMNFPTDNTAAIGTRVGIGLFLCFSTFMMVRPAKLLDFLDPSKPSSLQFLPHFSQLTHCGKAMLAFVWSQAFINSTLGSITLAGAMYQVLSHYCNPSFLAVALGCIPLMLAMGASTWSLSGNYAIRHTEDYFKIASKTQPAAASSPQKSRYHEEVGFVPPSGAGSEDSNSDLNSPDPQRRNSSEPKPPSNDSPTRAIAYTLTLEQAATAPRATETQLAIV